MMYAYIISWNKAHLRRHVKIHKRTENYTPRQRKLRNVVVQELEGNPSENKATAASLGPVESHAMVVSGQDGSSVEPDTDHQQVALGAGCIVDVVIDSSGVVMDANLAHMETTDGLGMQEVLQQSEMVTEAFESSLDVAEMVESISGAKN